MKSLVSYIAVFSVVLFVAGCSDGKINEVSGVVRFEGKPAANLIVNFTPEEGRPSWGETDVNGVYYLHYARDIPGAAPGRYKVTISEKPRPPKATGRVQNEPTPVQMALILEKYGNKETSPLSFEVNKNHQTIDIDLD